MNNKKKTSTLFRRAALTMLLAFTTVAPTWAQNEPTGDLEVVSGLHGSIHVKGWTEDPDNIDSRLTVAVYVKDNNNQPVEGYDPVYLTADQLRNGEDNQLHYNGYEDYLFIATAGTYKVDVMHVDATGDGSPKYTGINVQVSAPYTVTYNANGGSGAPAQQLKGENVDLTLTTDQPTWGSNGFLCWNTSSNGGGTTYQSGGTYSGNGDVTLYAMWSASFIPGSGTQSDPYLITSTEQWNLFANNVNNGNTYSGKWVKLGANITIGTMAGRENSPFRGTFDGGGHTMNLAIDATDIIVPAANNYQYELLEVAPFRHVDGATFIDLNLTGFVKATEYSQYGIGLGGLVGLVAEGHSVRILSCRSSVNVSYIFSHYLDGYEDNYTIGNMGGFIGTNAGTVVMDNCLFDGTLAGRPEYVGGFVGRQTPGTMTISNCLMNGSSGSGLYGTPQTVKITFCEVPTNTQHLTMTNCYYKTTIGDAQGTYTNNTGEALRSQLGSGWTVNDGGQVVPAPVTRYTITIDENIAHGTIVSSDAQSLSGETVTLTALPDQGYYGATITYSLTPSPSPEGEGGSFTLTLDYNTCSFTMPESNVTVTGTMNESTYYTVTYNLDGGSLTPDPSPSGEGSGNPTIYTAQSAPFTLVNPTREGYTFAGWTGTDISGTSLSVTVPHGSTGNRAYTATWAINSTITYILDGGTFPTPNPTVYSAMSDDITLMAPIRSGYSFAGWTGGLNSELENSNFEVQNSTLVVIPHGSTGDRTYTANWTSTSYTITYDLAGGSLPAPSGEGSGGEANPTEYTLTSPTFTLVNPTREGYTFAGWVGADINGQATTVTIPMGSVGNRSYTAIWAFNGDVSYQAYNTYTYRFNTLYTSNPTSVGTGSTWGSADSETWYIVDNNVTVSDRIEVNGTVNLILCDGKTLTATKGIHVGIGKTLNVFSQNGGTSGAITVNGANGDNAGIGANGNGGGLGTICFHGGTVTATGGSWSAGIGGATNAGGGTVTIYGGKIHGYRQSSNYGAAGGIGSGSGGNTTNVIIAEGLCLNNEYYNERPDHMGDRSILVQLCTAVSSRGHVFRDGRCRFCNIRQNYTVTYNANNATSGTVPTDATQYSNAGTGTATVLANSGNLQRTGFVFARWNTKADGSGTSYSAGQTLQVYHDVTLYAYWAEVYPITYDLAGGSVDTANPTGYHLFSDNITLNNPTREGYTFAGWTGSNGNTPQLTATIPSGSVGARTYTANWAPIVHLAVNADNTSAILEASSNPTTTVILDGYTLRRDGSWNTISLPFALGSFTGTPLEGAKVKSLSSSSVTGNTLTATFDETTSTVEGTPYIVKWEPDLVLRTEDDWNAFAANVTNSIETYEGMTVVLANDIGNTSDPVTTMVGDESHPFKGTFDGCGHTILFTKSLSHEQYLAPFRNAQNATFRNLRTRGNISTTLKFAAGLVAQSLGNCTIENCHSSIYIQSSMEDDGTNAGTYDGTHGGLIAVCRYSGSNTVRIANSLYDGTISGVVSGHQTRNCAGFVGWCEEGITLTFTNCLMAGELNVHSIASSGAFYRSNETHTLANCYQKGSQITLKQSNQTHTDAYGETLRAMLGDEWVLTSGDVFPKATNTNPIFTNVSVVNENENENTNAYVTFFGSYAPFSVGSLLPDSNNLSGNAFHGALSIHDVVPPTGYLIGNWYTDQAPATPATAIPFAASGEVTLFALYTPITYTVAFDANGGTGTMASQSFTYDAAQNLTANAFALTGYTFAGWSLSPSPSPEGEGSNLFADGESVSNLASDDGATVTLYAQWTPITYTVRFHKNDGGEDVYTDQTMTYDEPQLLTMGSFLREGYYIIGWSATPSLTPSPSPEGEGSGYLFADGQTVSNLATGQGDVVNLYAQWNEGYRISYDLAGGQWPMVGEEQAISPTGYTAGSEPITLVNPIRYGYTFAGWTGTGLDAATMTVTIPTGSTGTRAYTATWTITTYSITYELNGGIVVDGSNVDTYTFLDESITLVNPTREGYTFEGWTGSSLTEPTTTVTIPSGSTGDRTYTANWSPTTYTITYDLAGGQWPTANSQQPTTYTIETPTLTLANPTREGYTFAGWTGTGLNAATMTVTIAHGSTGDRSYTAMWTPITYTISYDLAGGQWPTANSQQPTIYTIETPTFTPVNPTREGYTFTGWTGGLVDENGTPVPETWNSEPVTTITITTGSTGNRTYTATWTPFVYTISYDLDGGQWPTANSQQPTTYTIETPTFTLVNPVRDGYYFVGWTGTGLAPTTGSVTIPTGSTGNRSYTANWVDYGSSVPYLAYNTETGEFEQGLATIYTEVTESTTAMANGFYVVRSGHIQNYDRVTVSGTVHLILCDGADLWWAGTSGGVNVENGATIHIYGQSGGTGKLTAGSQNRDAGIGPGNVIVHGGFLDAHGSSGCAAIGGAWGSLTGGTLTVYGGKVKGSDAGDYSPISCHATIIGGTVEATHHNQAFGGNVTLGDMKVYSSADATTPVDASQRESTCHSTYVKIVPCTEHNYSNGVCTWCGHTIIQVTYNGNGATSGTVPVDTTEYEFGQTATVLANTGSLERTGYTFAGWGLTPSPSPSGEGGGDLLVAGATFYISSYITLYAQWIPITYTVRFHKNDGGEEVYTDQQFTYDVAQSLTVNAFSNEDYIFVGWDTATISTITYTDGQTVSNLTDEQGAVIHLYALWVQQFYTITYDLAGGWYAGVSPADPYPNPTTYCEFSPAITLVNPIRNDLDFVGWTGTGLDVVTMTVTIPTGSTGNRTFTANWEDKVDYIAYNTTTHNFETRSKYGDRLNVTSEMTSMTNGWYVVGSDVTISSRITVTGTVNLILRDGKTLTASEGITVSEGNTLNIYGQIGGTGTLLSTISNGVNNAGIGSVGNSSNQCGTINIHGGNVTASSGNWSAGIGGGVNMNGGTINIYGGTVNAMGHDGSSEAIGHGSSGNSSGTRTIADGLRVTVNGSPVAYGSRVSSLGNMAARIEPCTEHNMSNGSCTWCGGTICHVTYNGNGATSGTVPTDATDYMTNQSVTVLANTGNLERTGYIFAGWSLTPAPSPSGEGSADLIAAGETFTISSSVTLYARWATHQLTLSSNENNTQAITHSSNNALHYDVTLDGYTLYRDGDWNTIVLPFDLDNFTGTPLEDATVKTLSSSSFNDGTLTINFSDDTDAIEAGKPYIVKWDNAVLGADLIIRSADEWDTFADNVTNSIETYEGMTVKLAADISVTTMVGTDGHEFKGTFDGCGHTLNVTLSGSNYYVAPFSYVNGCTIKNLIVTGEVNGGMHCSGLIGGGGGSTNTSLIENCDVRVSVKCNQGSKKTHCGGFIGHSLSGAFIFRNCKFSGSISGAKTYTGVFMGWAGQPATHINCLAAGTYSYSGTLVISKGTNTYTNCYTTRSIGSDCTYTTATGEALRALLGDGWEVDAGGNVVPKMVNSINNIVNPVFYDVIIDNSIANTTTTYADFIGSYAPGLTPSLTPLPSPEGEGSGGDGSIVLLDEHNPDGDALHAVLSVSEPTVSPTGYSIFAGWYIDAERTQAITQSSNQAIVPIPFATDGSVTLYAKWDPNTYTVHFNKNNDASTGTMDDQQFTYDEAQNLIANAFTISTTGYSFGGWSTTANGEVVYSDGQSVSNLTTTNNAIVELYAKWTPINYSITYNLAGGSLPAPSGEGSGEEANPTSYNILSNPITLVNPSRTGYTFAGWTGSNGDTPETTVTIATGSTGNLTYTANWTPIPYTITFVNDDDNSTVLQSGSVNYGELPEYEGETPTKEATAQHTYTFSGWNPEIITVTGDATYTAQYTATVNEYTITFKNWDNSVLQSSDVAYGETPEYTGVTPTKEASVEYTFTFTGWSPAITTVTGSATYTAQFSQSEREYSITYYGLTPDPSPSGEGSNNPTTYTASSEAITLVNPTRTGYTFAGWTGSNGDTPETTVTIASGSTGDLTFTANWTPITYTITYDLAGGQWPTANSQQPTTYTIETPTFTLVNPERDGYYFVGWTGGVINENDNENDNPQLTVTIPTGLTGNRSYTANWIDYGSDVPYLAYDTTSGTFETQMAQDYTEVTSSTTTMANGWYAVTSNIEISRRIEVTGTVNLILCDGKTLTVPRGMRVPSGVTLNIYGQGAGTGSIVISGSGISFGQAGIGGNDQENGGTVAIHGGIVTTTGGNRGSGIGGGEGSGHHGGSVAIYGGSVSATGGMYAAGIGGGQNGAGCTLVLITGGTVNATGNYGGAGIGGGWYGNGGDSIVITGGIVNATGGSYNSFIGAGIGGGYNGTGSTTVTFTGGTVTAIAGNSSVQAIGHGNGSSTSGTLTPLGEVKVFASADAAEPVAPNDRESTCRSSYAKLMACTEHQWVANTCSWCGATHGGVVYGRNHATGGLAPFDNTNYSNGQTVTVLGNTGNLERTGYTFAGWNTSADGTGTSYTEGNTFIFEGNTTLYAKWSAITYTISYDLNGGTVATPNPASYTANDNITLANPTKDGYSFGGWMGTGLVSPTITVTIVPGSAGNRAYTATWLPLLEYSAYNTINHEFGTLAAPSYAVVSSETTTMADGYYAVTGDTTISSRIEVTGTVHLILCDGATLTAPKGLHVPDGVTLNIYGQSAGTGTLTVSGVDDYQAGIGGNDQQNGGGLYIHGGHVTVTGGYNSAGIGGGQNGNGGSFVAYGGTITANSGSFGSGIGGGYRAGCNSVNIVGGTVNATGHGGGAGIGGGYYGNGGGTVTISGGIVNATGDGQGYGGAAGIGGGSNRAGCTTVTITGGTVTAIAGNSSAEAIGKGQSSSSSSGTLTPLGEVKVFASADAAEPVAPNDRESTCRSPYAKLMACTEHQWVANTCSWCGATHGGVVYGRNHATGGSAPVDNTNYSNGQTVTVLGNTGNLERTGYTYVGWSLTPDPSPSGEGGGDLLVAGATFQYNGNITLYAQWAPITYTITYELDGGQWPTANSQQPTTYTIESPAITLNNPIKENHVFGGWTGTGLTDATATVTIAKGSTGNREYTATWLPILEYQAYDTTTHNFERLSADAYFDVTSSTTTMAGGWYAVRDNYTIDSRIEVTGTVNLILCDEATLTVPNGLHVPAGVTLNIYGQSAGTGALNISGSGISSGYAGIGGNSYQNGGTLYMHGGIVTAHGGYHAPGIGAGLGNGYNGGSVTIYGGSVTAYGGEYGAGIGGGEHGTGCTSLIITGGTVNATGGTGGAGIGGGAEGGNGGNVTIHGGTVTATGKSSAAGIGGGRYGGDGGTVAITDGIVIAIAGNSSAQAIGHGSSSSESGDLTLGDMKVFARANAVEPVDSTVRVNTCRTTYAKLVPCTEHNWVDNSCTLCGANNNGVVYVANGATGGTVPVDNNQYTEGSPVTVLGNTGNLERANYTFYGWNTTADGSGTTYAANTTFTFTTPVVLYAKWAINTYTITFVNHDGTELQSSQVAYGQMPVYDGETPTKTATSEHTYTFSGWNPAITTVTCDATYTAQFTETPREYTITFVNHNGTTLQSGQVAYGETPEYSGETPTKEATSQYTYTFTGWSPAITTVTGDATYTAQFTETLRQYTITFVNYDNTVLQSGSVAYGETPEYTGVTPTKAADAQYTYGFNGWSPAITTVTGDATYTAQFTETVREYTITFNNYDGTELLSVQVAYGETPLYTGTTPTRAADDQYTYTFNGWSPEIVAVTCEATYTAQFTETLRQYTITFVNHDNTVLQSGTVAYGETPEYTGATPTKAADAQYTYTFSGWSPTIVAVTEDATYTAQYNATAIPHNVPYLAYNTTSGAFDACTATVAMPVTSATITMSDGWYAVNSNVTISDIINVTGTVNLILCDGATLTATYNIKMADGATLNIYGQAGGTGTLAMNPDYWYAIYSSNGNIAIHGGNINITYTDDETIGFYTRNTDVSIYGGNIALSGCGSGIDVLDGDLTIVGGDINISAGRYCMGIFVGEGDLTINGGNVNIAITGGRATGIYTDNCNIIIGGGNVSVSATGDDSHGFSTYYGDITLGWSSPDDRIYASSYYLDFDEGDEPSTLSVRSGQSFWNGTESVSGTVTDLSKVNGLTLIPNTTTDVTPATSVWQVISSPTHDNGQTYESIANVTNLTSGDYDMFRYDEASATWENQKASAGTAAGFSTMEPARGYIYRRSDATTLTFNGMPNDETTYSIALTANSSSDLKGFNLVGNPYPYKVKVDRAFYSLNADGTWTAHPYGDSIDVGQGVLVHTATGETLTFYAATRSTNPGSKGYLPPLPGSLQPGGQSDHSSNQTITQSSNQNFAYQQGDHLVITLPGHLEVYDALGRRLFNVEIRNSNFEIQNSKFPGTGVYILRLGGKTQKIVIY